jgi:hypothetical protein
MNTRIQISSLSCSISARHARVGGHPVNVSASQWELVPRLRGDDRVNANRRVLVLNLSNLMSESQHAQST